MKALLIGGTGQISAAITRKLVADGWDVYLLNRGNRTEGIPAEIHSIIADINDEEAVIRQIGDMNFDCVCEFIGFTAEHVERDY